MSTPSPIDALVNAVVPPKPTKQDNQPSNPYERRIKWEYAIPIVFTPSAHIFVSLLRKYPQYKKKLYWGIGIATFLTLQARFILMYDAGYPGAEKKDGKELPFLVKLLLF